MSRTIIKNDIKNVDVDKLPIDFQRIIAQEKESGVYTKGVLWPCQNVHTGMTCSAYTLLKLRRIGYKCVQLQILANLLPNIYRNRKTLH